jgi:hypothetical protein
VCLAGAISKLTALTRIDLDAVELTHRTAASLGKMTSLQSLTLHYCSLDQAGDNGFVTQSLGNLTALRYLSLNGTRNLGLAQAGGWAKSLSSLTTLNLFGTGKTSNGHLHALRSLRALNTLHLVWTCKPEPVAKQRPLHMTDDNEGGRMQSISAMAEYRSMSVEELRWESYSAAAISPSAEPAAAVLSLRVLWRLLIRALLAIPRALHGALQRVPGGSPQLHRPGLSPAQSKGGTSQAKEESATHGAGATTQHPFRATQWLEPFLNPSQSSKMMNIQSISAMAEHRGMSVEELRFQDYCAGVKGGGTGAVSAAEHCSSVHSLAALVGSLPALSALHLHLHAAMDRGVAALSDHRLTALVSVRLQLNAQLTDRGLLPLCALPSLSEVLLVTGDSAAVITAAGEKALRDTHRNHPPFHLTVRRGTARTLGFSELL